MKLSYIRKIYMCMCIKRILKYVSSYVQSNSYHSGNLSSLHIIRYRFDSSSDFYQVYMPLI